MRALWSLLEIHEVKMQKITSVFHNDPQKYHVQLEDDDHPEKDKIFLKNWHDLIF